MADVSTYIAHTVQEKKTKMMPKRYNTDLLADRVRYGRVLRYYLALEVSRALDRCHNERTYIYIYKRTQMDRRKHGWMHHESKHAEVPKCDPES